MPPLDLVSKPHGVTQHVRALDVDVRREKRAERRRLDDRLVHENLQHVGDGGGVVLGQHALGVAVDDGELRAAAAEGVDGLGLELHRGAALDEMELVCVLLRQRFAGGGAHEPDAGAERGEEGDARAGGEGGGGDSGDGEGFRGGGGSATAVLAAVWNRWFPGTWSRGARSRIARETGASEGIDAPGVGLASARGVMDDDARRRVPRDARGNAPRGARTASDGPAGMAKISAATGISAAKEAECRRRRAGRDHAPTRARGRRETEPGRAGLAREVRSTPKRVSSRRRSLCASRRDPAYRWHAQSESAYRHPIRPP